MSGGRFAIGRGPLRIFVLSPLSPLDPERAIFAAMLSPYLEQAVFTVADCLEDYRPGGDLKDLVARWGEKIPADCDGFVGFSFGGCVLQHLADRPALRGKPLLLPSSCTHVGDRLEARLKELLGLLECGREVEAFALLQERVREGSPRFRAEPKPAEGGSARKLRDGFRMLLEHDARGFASRSESPALFLVGGSSGLVGADDVEVLGAWRRAVIPGAGMRVLSDQPRTCRAAIERMFP